MVDDSQPLGDARVGHRQAVLGSGHSTASVHAVARHDGMLPAAAAEAHGPEAELDSHHSREVRAQGVAGGQHVRQRSDLAPHRLDEVPRGRDVVELLEAEAGAARLRQLVVVTPAAHHVRAGIGAPRDLSRVQVRPAEGDDHPAAVVGDEREGVHPAPHRAAHRIDDLARAVAVARAVLGIGGQR